MSRFLASRVPNLLAKSLFGTEKSAAAKKLVLFTSDDCSLCVHFKKHLDSFLNREKEILVAENKEIVVEIRDIKLCDRDTFERFKHDIPVLTAGDDVVCKHRFSTILFKRHLGLADK